MNFYFLLFFVSVRETEGAAGDVQFFEGAGIALEEINLSLEKNLVRVQNVITLVLKPFSEIDISCESDQFDNNQIDSIMAEYDNLFSRNLDDHINNYFLPKNETNRIMGLAPNFNPSAPVRTDQNRPKRAGAEPKTFWNGVLDTVVSTASNFIMYRKIQNSINNLEAKLQTSMKYITKEFSLLRANMCHSMQQLAYSMTIALANSHMASSIHEVDLVVYSFLNGLTLHQSVPKMLFRSCKKINPNSICRELIMSNKIRSTVVAIERDGHNILLQVISEFPEITGHMVAHKIVNFGLLTKKDKIITKSKILGISSVYYNFNPIDMSLCEEINKGHLMCYQSAIQKHSNCYQNILSGNSLITDCQYENGTVPYDCTIKDLSNYYIVQTTDYTPLLGVGEVITSDELPPGNHILRLTETMVLGCDSPEILHPFEHNIKIVKNSENYVNITSANFIDRDLISMLKTDNLMTDQVALERALAEILDVDIYNGMDITTLFLILSGIFVLILVALLALFYYVKTRNIDIPMIF